MTHVHLTIDTCQNLFRGKLKSFPLRGYLYIPLTFFFLFHYFPSRTLEKAFCNFHLSTFTTSFTTSPQKSTMASRRIISHTLSIPSAADISGPILVDNRAYVPEPLIEEDKRKILYSQVLIPYSISSRVCAFMGPLPRHIRKPQVLEYFFPISLSRDPLVLVHKPIDLCFMKNRVFQSSPPTRNPPYTRWLDRVQQKRDKYGKIKAFLTWSNSQELT